MPDCRQSLCLGRHPGQGGALLHFRLCRPGIGSDRCTICGAIRSLAFPMSNLARSYAALRSQIPRPPARPGPLPRLDADLDADHHPARRAARKAERGGLHGRPAAHPPDLPLRRRHRALPHRRRAAIRPSRPSGCPTATAPRTTTTTPTPVAPAAPPSASPRQIGCAVNCQFCLTAKLGIERNLTAGEIAGQVVAVLRRHQVELGRDRINLVFMGMGEPFLNYDAFMDAVRLLVEEVGIPASRMTVSTSGIVPGIERFAQEPRSPESRHLAQRLEQHRPRSRHAHHAQMAHRAAPRSGPQPSRCAPREKITFEYVLLGGVNDSLVHADEVVALARRAGFPKVNLIVWNPGPGIPYHQPQDEDVAALPAAPDRARRPGLHPPPPRPRYLRRLRPARRRPPKRLPDAACRST